MGTDNKTGGPVFPTFTVNRYEAQPFLEPVDDGMCMLDYFASKAMQGMVAGFQNDSGNVVGYCVDQLAQQSYAIALAMLNARNEAIKNIF